MDRNKMERNKALFRAINRMSSEASTREELSAELRFSGVDPDQLVERVRSYVAATIDPTTNRSTKEGKRFSLPLINQLRRLTDLSPNDIARRLDIPLAFLSAIERQLDITPFSWRDELATRVERAFQISKEVAVELFASPSRLEIANLNKSPSSQDTTLEDILDMSEMDEKSKQFWLDLARTR
jgi:hypothetical protein